MICCSSYSDTMPLQMHELPDCFPGVSASYWGLNAMWNFCAACKFSAPQEMATLGQVLRWGHSTSRQKRQNPPVSGCYCCKEKWGGSTHLMSICHPVWSSGPRSRHDHIWSCRELEHWIEWPLVPFTLSASTLLLCCVLEDFEAHGSWASENVFKLEGTWGVWQLRIHKRQWLNVKCTQWIFLKKIYFIFERMWFRFKTPWLALHLIAAFLPNKVKKGAKMSLLMKTHWAGKTQYVSVQQLEMLESPVNGTSRN